MSAESWSEERVNRLKVLWAQGLSCSQIANELNKLQGKKLTRNAVISKRDRAGLPGRDVQRSRARTVTRKPKQAKAAPAAPRAPRIIAEERPIRSRAPMKTEVSVRFIDRSPNQCAMFCEGEEGASGFVCGAEVMRGQWCSSCVRLVYQPMREAA